MRIDARILATCSLLLAAACGGSSSGSLSGFQAAIQGTWVGQQCIVLGANASGTVTLAISGATVNAILNTHGGLTCAGASIPETVATGTITIGGPVTATLESNPVTAYQIDLPNIIQAGTTVYDIGYVDVAQDPDRLYTGDLSGTNDGSTAALRPTTLDATVYFTKQQ